MAEDIQNKPTEQVEQKRSKEFKFMTNVTKGAVHQTRYMKSLEKVTMDAQVSYMRMYIAMGIGGLFIFIFGVGALNNTQKLPYIFIPAVLILVSVFIIIVNYLISSRTKSMLVTALKLGAHPYLEGVRRKAKGLGDIKSVGIQGFKKGVITFTNGDKGVLYKIDGNLSLSTLPGVADAVANAKAQYLIARTPTSQEQMIVSISATNVQTQMAKLREYFTTETGHEMRDLWAKAMSLQIQNHITEYISDEFTVVESLIVRDKDIPTLKKSIANFEQSARSGLYANYRRIMEPSEFAELLGPLTMLSKKGRLAFGQEQQPKRKRVA